MKLLIPALALFMLAYSCKNSTATTASTEGAANASADTATYTTVEWLDSLKDVGRIKFGETKKINFRFRNTGSHPLFIIAAEPGCGCTVSDFPKEAIAPGKEGAISAAFDSNKGHEGEFRKNIKVTTNTKDNTTHFLYFMGIIYKDGIEDSTTTQNR